jgi:putative tryptophan/tyrosine transport system substrate-binding protein
VNRREFISLLGGAASWPFTAHAQRLEKGARVGFLRQAGPHAKQFDAFRDGLRAAGYIEGRNLLIEQRYAAGAYERLSGLAAELVRANVDVIVVDGTVAARACKDATATIPVVFALAVDPVADGLAASFAHPGGNLTGLTMTAGYGLPLSVFGQFEHLLPACNLPRAGGTPQLPRPDFSASALLLPSGGSASSLSATDAWGQGCCR